MEKQTKRKFNIVDVVVLVILLAAIAFFAYKLLNAPKDTGDAAVRMGTASFTVEVDGVRKELYDSIAAEIPCQMMAGTKMVNGRILSVSSEPCTVAMVEASSSTTNSTSNRYVIPAEGEEYVNLFLECEAEIEIDSPNNASMSQEIRLGRYYFVKSKMIELVGTVTRLELSEG